MKTCIDNSLNSHATQKQINVNFADQSKVDLQTFSQQTVFVIKVV